MRMAAVGELVTRLLALGPYYTPIALPTTLPPLVLTVSFDGRCVY